MAATEQIRAWIKAVIGHHGWTLHEWARKAEVPHPALYRFLNSEHKTISTRNLSKLAAVTTVPLVVGRETKIDA